ncbi:flagellar basal-body rod protein FlgC [Alicyclobacillus hesperidum subsp. aegles]|uniref:Flagellar basal-body rod protein FlgC n=1 Tax=Alicyclobacillus hesperidum TaxID=89784 RepID=A0A1H2SFI6_9BACL|nr:flagellar basal body rod protein FlgC [Alicyclobacillus hesperidum]KRW90988.1 flagellar basal body rod protein FlgC [Alicyclobacillus tengchongensis]GLG00556.1 flagellar basal-body rod protein FlgC [Alicyclobacillus hesperidum subsp. aegles]GLV12356.1 flagellar basal-body rod protein FlgC [Alicyclobacillus hesperidum]SDW30396.1 flagellar basal-body rod protein FlgC [Alicyclobacillus hesperidum]
MLDNSSMNISASGLAANQLWMNVIANNIANANTTRTPQGGPYRSEIVNFQAVQQPASFQTTLGQAMTYGGGGVEVSSITQDTSPFQLVYDPSSPDAVNGYVKMPNVDIATQMVDLVQASRAYEANATAFDAAKQMAVSALSIGK